MHFNDRATVEYLIPLLRDPNWIVRKNAVIVLGKLEAAEAYNEIARLASVAYRQEISTEAQHLAVEEAVTALGQLKNFKAIKIFKNIVCGGVNTSISEWKETIKVRAVMALANFNHPDATRVLISALTDKDSAHVQKIAADLLNTQTSEGCLQFMLDALKLKWYEDDLLLWKRQELVILSLGRRGDKTVIPHLLSLLNTEYSAIKLALLKALKQLEYSEIEDVQASLATARYEVADFIADKNRFSIRHGEPILIPSLVIFLEAHRN
jgi:hypothetical protein